MQGLLIAIVFLAGSGLIFWGGLWLFANLKKESGGCGFLGFFLLLVLFVVVILYFVSR